MVEANSYPTVIAPGGEGQLELQMFNVGAAATKGQFVVTDKLPVGVTAVTAGSWAGGPQKIWDCTGNGGSPGEKLVKGASEVRCVNDPEYLRTFFGGAGNPTREYTRDQEAVAPSIKITIEAGPREPTESNRVSVTGGEAVSASTTDPIRVGTGGVPFEFNDWNTWFSKADGEVDTQAGSHPYAWTTTFDLATAINQAQNLANAGGEARNLFVKLPPGVLADPYAVPQCTRAQFVTVKCPHASMVGNLTAVFTNFSPVEVEVYNLVPPAGEPLELGFTLNGISVYIGSGVRSGEDYGVNSPVDNIPQREIVRTVLTLWGVPLDPTHDRWRGVSGECTAENPTKECPPIEPDGELKPFLTVPTACEGPQAFSISANTWNLPIYESEDEVISHDQNGKQVGFTNCAALPFSPSVSARPTTGASDSPSGLDFDLHFPLQGLQEPEGITEATLKNTSVTFPPGFVLNPSAADGLEACSESQVGFTGFKELNPTTEPGVQTPQFTPGQAECPDTSKLGSVEVDTPLIGHPMPGAIYLAKQGENPYGSLLAIYITVYDPISGIVVKIPGRVEANPQTGQLTTTIQQSPEVSFEDFKIDLFAGARARLTTPTTCGTFTTDTQLTPWSEPEASPSSPSGSFEITSGPNGAPCAATPAQEPNAPSFSAGTFSPIAGTYSPFVLHLAREDGSQGLRALNVTLPEGLLGKLAGVGECPQADIEAAERLNGEGQGQVEAQHPSCPGASEVGSAHVGAGSGGPYYVSGHAYLAGPYKGAPYSIVVITPAIAGPFDLGTVVVRSALFIDPKTAQVSVQTDPLPTILDGIPLDLRSISVEVTRPGFTFNPTSCEKMTVTATVFAESSQAPLSSPFQVGGCNGLPFKPSFAASTAAKASRASGASLHVTVTAHLGEANVHKVSVQIPSQLPSRLTTLKEACTEAQFAANPAGCPVASKVASAVVHTPILNAPLSGPVYFVSHGGAAFPDLVMVLQSEGITIDLVGNTEIKGKITYSRFEAIPDAPFTTFELEAPQGPNSILSANLPASAKFSFCGQNLIMPVILTGQNGLVASQNAKLTVTGCPKTRAAKLTRAQKLARALKACKKVKNKHKRSVCQAEAHKKYGPVKAKKKTSKKKK